jgi:nicotinate-nucleotide adenylyltransferase
LIAQLLSRDLVDEIVIIPAGNPWMRESAPVASAHDRMAMVKLAIAGLPQAIQSRVSVSDREVLRYGPTYTIDTVEEFRKLRPKDSIVLILGSDAAANIGQWHRSGELLAMVELLVIARDGDGLDIDALAVSSTRIRKEIESHMDAKQEVPESVWKYIQERNLYASR